MKQIKTIKSRGRLAPFWVVVGIFLVTTVAFTIETATSGAVLAKEESREATLLQENSDLKDAVVRASSLNGVEKKSLEMGFVKPSKILYINGSEEVAKLP